MAIPEALNILLTRRLSKIALYVFLGNLAAYGVGVSFFEDGDMSALSHIFEYSFFRYLADFTPSISGSVVFLNSAGANQKADLVRFCYTISILLYFVFVFIAIIVTARLIRSADSKDWETTKNIYQKKINKSGENNVKAGYLIILILWFFAVYINFFHFFRFSDFSLFSETSLLKFFFLFFFPIKTTALAYISILFFAFWVIQVSKMRCNQFELSNMGDTENE